jgi:hypothetical protein
MSLLDGYLFAIMRFDFQRAVLEAEAVGAWQILGLGVGRFSRCGHRHGQVPSKKTRLLHAC